MKKIMAEVKEGRRGNIYRLMCKLGNRPCDDKSEQFRISSHVEQNLSPVQSAKRISDYFTEISNEFLPLHLNNLRPDIRLSLSKTDGDIPFLSFFSPHFLLFLSLSFLFFSLFPLVRDK